MKAVPRNAKMDQQMRRKRRHDRNRQQKCQEPRMGDRAVQTPHSPRDENQGRPERPRQGHPELNGVPRGSVDQPEAPN